jgi:hypothetical protein
MLAAVRHRGAAADRAERFGPGTTANWPEELLRSLADSDERRAALLERSAERRLAAVVDNDPAVIAAIRSKYVVHFVLHGREPHDRESERGHSPYPCGTADSDTLDPSEATRGVRAWKQVTCRRCLASRREIDRHHDLQSSAVCPRCFTLRTFSGECLC